MTRSNDLSYSQKIAARKERVALAISAMEEIHGPHSKDDSEALNRAAFRRHDDIDAEDLGNGGE